MEITERAKNKYRELSKEEKDITREYGRNRYDNMFEEKKQRPKEYQRNYRELKKSTYFFYLCFFKHLLIKMHSTKKQLQLILMK